MRPKPSLSGFLASQVSGSSDGWEVSFKDPRVCASPVPEVPPAHLFCVPSTQTQVSKYTLDLLNEAEAGGSL